MQDLNKLGIVESTAIARCTLVVGLSWATLSMVGCADDTTPAESDTSAGEATTGSSESGSSTWNADSSDTSSGSTTSTDSSSDSTSTGSDSTSSSSSGSTTDTSSSGGSTESTETSTNTPPTAEDGDTTTVSGQPIDIMVDAEDADDDELTYSIVTAPEHGSLSGEGPTFTYHPTADFVGQDSFEWRANDGTDDSNVATITIEVTEPPVNVPPVADDLSFQVLAGSSVDLRLRGRDADGDDLTYSLVSQPNHGVISGTAPDLVYTPRSGFTGADSFRYKCNDGMADSPTADVSLTVLSNNSAPAAQDQSLNIPYETVTHIHLSAIDPDRDGMTYLIVDRPNHGTIEDPFDNPDVYPELEFVPDDGFRGWDSFTFTASDGEVTSAPATVYIQVGNTNAPPVTERVDADVPTGIASPIELMGSDPEDGTLSYEVAYAPSHGEVRIVGGVASYTSDSDFVGVDNFYYRANDGEFDSNVSRVRVVVGGDNLPPVAYDDEFEYTPGDTFEFTLRGSDPDGDPLIFRLLSRPHTGELTGEPPNLVYTGAGSSSGSTMFQFNVFDGKANSKPATIRINRRPD